ncbi:unnamed protein product [Cyclocybe aegerita]|uniref:Fungal-type protein kinase domain-containing protein n=1 Tax=Cyclocybe aegerita TaxID=1973307 RepID=A0A8S0WR21_CYCAE|nr:unnamed protein product [Cyclocybe aegerita]
MPKGVREVDYTDRNEPISFPLLMLTDVHVQRPSCSVTCAPPAMTESHFVHPLCPLSPHVRHSLVDAKSSTELCEALIHVVLGWFSFYQAGYLHRDISIRTVFLCPSPVEQRAFEISADFHQTATKSVEDLTLLLKGVSVDECSYQLNDIEEKIMRVEQLVQELGVTTTCSAFIIDSDMAIPWETCLDSGRDNQEILGNPEFVSSKLAQSIERNSDYLQSPVDDLFSVYWVALWAILNNIPTSRRSDDELWWRKKIAEGRRFRDDASVDICRLSPREWKSQSPIVQQWSPVLDSWFQSLDRLDKDWRRAADPPDDVKVENSRDFYLPLFHYFALRGVADFLEVIKSHYTQLCNYLPFA